MNEYKQGLWYGEQREKTFNMNSYKRGIYRLVKQGKYTIDR